jgi:hypothetical protein
VTLSEALGKKTLPGEQCPPPSASWPPSLRTSLEGAGPYQRGQGAGPVASQPCAAPCHAQRRTGAENAAGAIHVFVVLELRGCFLEAGPRSCVPFLCQRQISRVYIT